ncbi:asparagine synthetase [glutamine-hydrolyzing] [Belonocnema kinseyi]|uniref:asparagine synthetase [glutamine-hydrolyzing] n=1 Tax=Belonocnema kinseyi TaxID=2817044 RepID=UPI00143CCB33|nr:asparagine synthetase [glutamine-hydrolyzing] [Belonocnema kinseyi]XP_033211902.1 asparagine synthetase [glutamine-hydrolyzing] [Belonocnema kinseyi]XP_033211903.1 asparagine synthetase [glutamine-hydrolyzing] [Belonocnema kinseyi]XP_033211904.1 asparagine synthetase [glutamine-hydrolyzing] [Belonocnema kinseyi]
MCGIWALFGLECGTLACVCNNFGKISHRGPDAFKVEYDSRIKDGYLGFHRLSIVDGLCGMQPMRLCAYPELFLLCNGEIYNYKKLGKENDFHYTTKCDVEAILHLYTTAGAENVARSLDGVFAFCILDVKKRRILIARDPYGVRPLFILRDSKGRLGVSSESKGLFGITNQFPSDWTLQPFPPGYYEEYEISEKGKVTLLRSVQYHKPGDKPSFPTFVPWTDLDSKDISGNIKKLFLGAIQKRLMSERRIGCFLSGGLDSSLVAALLAKEAKEMNFPYKLQTFAIGMGDSPDILAARQVADHIGTEHHEINFTEKDIEDVLDDVIYQLETFDITTIRASVGMYLISRYVKKNTDTTVVFSGEGADELAQGYIYFKNAPDAVAAHEESLRLLKDIYLYDGLRADRSTSAFSLELRAPFLDLQFTHYFLSLEAVARQPQNGVEKHLLRSAFEETNLLPKNVLWRHKEAFSDGVTSVKKSLFQIIQEIVENRVDNNELDEAATKYPHCTPTTKEALYYRKVFEKHFENQAKSLIPYFWMPKWIEGISDPSARFIKHYAADKQQNGVH